LDGEILPVLAVPTTAGTGSEVSLYAVITDEKTRIKDSLSEGRIYPKIAWIDADLMDGLPAQLTAFTGMDALGHALEAILSTIENPMADFYAIEAMKRIFTNLPKAVKKDKEARDQMAFSAMLAGAAMSHCGAALPHGLGCPLSGHLDLPHGLTVGILQIPMLRISKPVIEEKVSWINRELNIEGRDPVEALIEAIEKLEETIGFPTKLEATIEEAMLVAMVEDAMIHGCTGLNPKALSKEDVEAIYRAL
jgi:alcohol dehydrogenase class IV